MWSGTVGIGTLSEMNGYRILSDLISPHVLAKTFLHSPTKIQAIQKKTGPSLFETFLGN